MEQYAISVGAWCIWKTGIHMGFKYSELVIIYHDFNEYSFASYSLVHRRFPHHLVPHLSRNEMLRGRHI